MTLSTLHCLHFISSAMFQPSVKWYPGFFVSITLWVNGSVYYTIICKDSNGWWNICIYIIDVLLAPIWLLEAHLTSQEPHLIYDSLELATLWLHLVSHCSIHLMRSPRIPQFLSLQSNRKWGILSKALQKSSNTRSTYFLLSIAFRISSVRDKSWLWQEQSGLKPSWCLLIILFLFKWSIIKWKTMCFIL